MIAVSIAVNKALYGKKAKGEYPNKAFLQVRKELEEEKEIITQEEAKRQRKNLLSMLQIMQINFANNHNE